MSGVTGVNNDMAARYEQLKNIVNGEYNKGQIYLGKSGTFEKINDHVNVNWNFWSVSPAENAATRKAIYQIIEAHMVQKYHADASVALAVLKPCLLGEDVIEKDVSRKWINYVLREINDEEKVGRVNFNSKYRTDRYNELAKTMSDYKIPQFVRGDILTACYVRLLRFDTHKPLKDADWTKLKKQVDDFCQKYVAKKDHDCKKIRQKLFEGYTVPPKSLELHQCQRLKAFSAVCKAYGPNSSADAEHKLSWEELGLIHDRLTGIDSSKPIPENDVVWSKLLPEPLPYENRRQLFEIIKNIPRGPERMKVLAEWPSSTQKTREIIDNAHRNIQDEEIKKLKERLAAEEANTDRKARMENRVSGNEQSGGNERLAGPQQEEIDRLRQEIDRLRQEVDRLQRQPGVGGQQPPGVEGQQRPGVGDQPQPDVEVQQQLGVEEGQPLGGPQRGDADGLVEQEEEHKEEIVVGGQSQPGVEEEVQLGGLQGADADRPVDMEPRPNGVANGTGRVQKEVNDNAWLRHWACCRDEVYKKGPLTNEGGALSRKFQKELYGQLDAHGLVELEKNEKRAIAEKLFMYTDEFDVFSDPQEQEVKRLLDLVFSTNKNDVERRKRLLKTAAANFETVFRSIVQKDIAEAREKGKTPFIGGAIGHGAPNQDLKVIARIYAEECVRFGEDMVNAMAKEILAEDEQNRAIFEAALEEAKITCNPRKRLSSIRMGQLKDLAKFARGSREGAKGGKGYMGVIKGKAVKFLTHPTERLKTPGSGLSPERKVLTNKATKDLEDLFLAIAGDISEFLVPRIKRMIEKIKQEGQTIDGVNQIGVNQIGVNQMISRENGAAIIAEIAKYAEDEAGNKLDWEAAEITAPNTIPDTTIESVLGRNYSLVEEFRVAYEFNEAERASADARG